MTPPLPIGTSGGNKLVADRVHAAFGPVGVYPLAKSLVGEQPVRQRRSGRAVDDRFLMATLVDVNGVLRWRPGLSATPVAGRRMMRAGFGDILGLSGDPVTTVKFEATLGVNEITKALEELDGHCTPDVDQPAVGFALRAVKNGQFVNLRESDIKKDAADRILLFIHGTFSNNRNVLDQIAQTDPSFLPNTETYYSQVLAFDHYTVSRSPVLNALALARMFAASNAQIDVVCHSRGGLVTRWFMEVLDRNPSRKRRAVLVGCPISGTDLAAPDRLRHAIDLFTNIGAAAAHGVELIPFLAVAGALLKIVFSVISVANKTPLVDAGIAMVPGLAAMSRVKNSYELMALQTPSNPSPEYFAITSDYQPTAPEILKFWTLFTDLIQKGAYLAEKPIFTAANDLVVNTASMTEWVFAAPLPPTHVKSYGTNDTVYHTNYFQQMDTLNAIRGWLKI